MDNQHFVIGVDGGGTKTVAAVADEKGKIVARKEGGPANYHAIGEASSRKNLKKVLASLLRRYQVNRAIFGLAGLDSRKDRIIYRKIIKSLLPSKIKFSLYNDAEIALEAMSCPGPKVLIIAGTGSTVWGQRGKRKIKSGGWDFILSDEGSAYYLGLQALRAAMRSFDGRGPKTVLEKLVIQKTKAKNIPDMATKIYFKLHKDPVEFKVYIASFAPLVGRAFAKKDKVAKMLLEKSADELFLGVKAVVKKLNIARTDICVGYVGSAFYAPLLQDRLAANIKKLVPKAYFVRSLDPVRGAIKMAENLIEIR